LRGIENLRVGDFFGKIFPIKTMGPVEVEMRYSSSYQQKSSHLITKNHTATYTATNTVLLLFEGSSLIQEWAKSAAFCFKKGTPGDSYFLGTVTYSGAYTVGCC
jgi:hypothetical protein